MKGKRTEILVRLDPADVRKLEAARKRLQQQTGVPYLSRNAALVMLLRQAFAQPPS